jgi:hypothetical protein
MREAELMARDRWAREEVLAFQRERVQALVAHALTNSPFTAKRWVLMPQSDRFLSCLPCRRPP